MFATYETRNFPPHCLFSPSFRMGTGDILGGLERLLVASCYVNLEGRGVRVIRVRVGPQGRASPYKTV